MSIQEEYDEYNEYLEDPLILIGVEPPRLSEEHDIQDLITIEDEVIIGTSCNFNAQIYDEYINSIIKDTSILPYSFCRFKENLKYLDLCRPLSVRVTDCNKFPWYERDMAKIIHNKDLEQNIQSKQNNQLLHSKFKEILGNKCIDTIDANNVTLNNKSDIKIVDIDDEEISDYIRHFDRINRSQNNYNECDTDDFTIEDDISENHLFDNLNTPKIKKSSEVISSKILEPCRRIDCISLSMDKRAHLLHSNKMVPHYHEKKNDKIITSGVNKPLAKRKVTKGHGIRIKIKEKTKNITILNKATQRPTQTLIADPYIECEYDLTKLIKQSNKANTNGIQAKQLKKTNKLNSRTKERKEKVVINIKELQDKYFSKSASLISPNVGANSTQLCNHYINRSNILKVSDTDKCNLFHPRGHSYKQYTPYFLSKIENQNSPINLYLKTASDMQILQSNTLQNLQTYFECNQTKHFKIDIRNDDWCKTESMMCNKETALRFFKSPMHKSVKPYEKPKKNYVQSKVINSLKSSKGKHQEELRLGRQTNVTVKNHEIFTANNTSMENKTSDHIGKTDKICNNNYIERVISTSSKDISVKTLQEKLEFNNNLIPCVDESIAILSDEIKEIQHKYNFTKNIAHSKYCEKLQGTKEQKQAYTYNKEQDTATYTHKNTYSEPPSRDNTIISQNDKTVTELGQKQIKERITKPNTDSKVHLNNQEESYSGSKTHCTHHGRASTSSVVHIVPNLKAINQTGSGYSPPILPIPTYQKVFEILTQVNLRSKFKRNMECRDGPTAHWYNEGILTNRRITLDMQKY